MIALEPYHDVHIVQGDIQVNLTNKTFALETNGNRSTVYYEVTQAPTYGELVVNNRPVMNFSQADVDAGRLFYTQFDLDSALDTFELDVRDAARNEIRGVVVEVIVEPLLNQRDVVSVAAVDGPFKITLDLLDASALASKTDSVPVYDVIELPRLGTLSVTSDADQQPRRRRRRRDDSPTRQQIARKRRDENIDDESGRESVRRPTQLAFSHEDVEQDRVVYTPDPNAAPGGDGGPQEDGFIFLLLADNVQPAQGSLRFQVNLPPATEASPVDADEDEYAYIYVDDVDDDEENGSEYVTTALIVAGGALTSICSIVSYRCYRLSRRRRRKRRQRELEALQQDGEQLKDRPEPVKRHAADLHPSEPLLTRSVWMEPMYVATSEGELRRIRAEHWKAGGQSRLNDALRCAGVASTVDDQPQAAPGDSDRDQTLPCDSAFRRSPTTQNARSPQTSNRGDDFTPQSALFDRFGGTQPRPSTRDDPTETETSDRQRGLPTLSHLTGPLAGTSGSDTASRQSDMPPTLTDALSSWVNKPDATYSSEHPPRSTQPPSTTHSYHDDTAPSESTRPTAARYPGGPLGTMDMERYFNDRQTPAVDRGSTQRHLSRQDPENPTPDHSSVPFPGSTPLPSDPHALRPFTPPPSIADRGAPERDGIAHAPTRQRGRDACANGFHCDSVRRDDVVTGVTPEKLPGDVDGGYVTGPRPQRQPVNRDISRGQDDETGSAETGPAAAAQQVMYDWDKVDPQLIDLCRKTSPVLDKNQYWV